MSSSSEILMKLLDGKNKETDKSEEKQVNLEDDSSERLQLKVLEARVDRLIEENEGLKQDRKQRKYFSICIFGFMCLYMAFALFVVYRCGTFDLFLSDKVLITLLSTTLANVIGVFNFVAKYLFNPKS